jgi:hypothetical protein
MFNCHFFIFLGSSTDRQTASAILDLRRRHRLEVRRVQLPRAEAKLQHGACDSEWKSELNKNITVSEKLFLFVASLYESLGFLDIFRKKLIVSVKQVLT